MVYFVSITLPQLLKKKISTSRFCVFRLVVLFIFWRVRFFPHTLFEHSNSPFLFVLLQICVPRRHLLPPRSTKHPRTIIGARNEHSIKNVMFPPPTFLHRDTPEVPTPLLEATPSLVVTLASFCGAYLLGSACVLCVVV